MPSWNAHFNLEVRTNYEEIIKQLATIDALSSVIRGIPIPPHVQRRLDQLNIVRAVRGTTGIEGAEVSENEV